MATGSGTGTPITASVAPTAEAIVAAIDAALLANAIGGALASYNIGGKRVEFDLVAFQKLREYYQGLITVAALGGSRVVKGGLSQRPTS